MRNEELKKIIEKHEKCLKSQECGERANLHGADLYDADLSDANLCGADLSEAILYGANLRGANLHGADLCGADLRHANLCGADLSDANLCGADLYGADLHGADLRRANLCGADLHGANLRYANLYAANLHGADLSEAILYDANLCDADLSEAILCGANLRGADLHGADLRYANLYAADLYDADLRGAKNVPFVPMTCPDSGSFTAWKKAHGHIVKLLIPEDARRSSATGRKCRCDKAVVIAIETVNGESAELDEIASDHDGTFIYKVGETVTETNFCGDRFNECAAGIHFFINRQEAVDYN